MNIELHLFTNSSISSPSTSLIEKTYKSFLKTFKINLETFVWVDPNPNIKEFEEYQKNLKKIFKNIQVSNSLSDGYVRGVDQSNKDFLFMLEHDWIFTENLKHSLEDILKVMYDNNLIHLRFNKRNNIVKNWDKELLEVKTPIFDYCLTSNISNNPHIINRSIWLTEAKKYIKIQKGNTGIEQELIKANLKGAIYGGLNYPNTIQHLDGKANKNF